VGLRAGVDISEKVFFGNLDSKPGPCIPFFYISGLLLYPLQYAFILNVFDFWCLPSEFHVHSISLCFYFTFSFPFILYLSLWCVI